MNVSDLIKLDANENVYGPHSSVLDALRDVPLHIYPDPSQGNSHYIFIFIYLLLFLY